VITFYQNYRPVEASKSPNYVIPILSAIKHTNNIAKKPSESKQHGGGLTVSNDNYMIPLKNVQSGKINKKASKPSKKHLKQDKKKELAKKVLSRSKNVTKETSRT